ncbi:hypothetical protein CSUB_C1262 [Candidatus Caldarchaeum subterraneum]|uniref:DUF447 family protein n=1 Tax=Caldiarchaeum subterraneum TaxID=311458 RepID=E6N7Q7_CALS0|nr:hypothetical protein HGMM_F01G10C19 [Candidatus Caldarchaeum subterraneum]BAJ51113.1 hypothetical protein CSUB_C1262 [Candidatus Caldarchaeum subterraneum]
MKKVSELGFRTDSWYEVIVSTYLENGEPHFAAMGCGLIDDEHLIVKPYTNTETYRNLLSHRAAAVNVTNEPYHFYAAVFNKPLPHRRGEKVTAPLLDGAEAWIEAVVENISADTPDRATVTLTPITITSAQPVTRPYSRASHAIVEMLIHYTRVKVFAHSSEHSRAVSLAEKILDYSALVRRVTSNPVYLQICDEVVNELKKLGVLG